MTVWNNARVFAVAISLCAAGCSNETPREPSGVSRQALGSPPVNAVPGTQSVNEDSPLHFSGLAGNAISVADPDSNTLTVQLIVTNGTLVTGTAAQGTTVSGNGTFSVIVTGPIDGGIVKTLDDSIFTPAPNFNGAASLQMNSSDIDGNADLDVVTINVTAFNDPPTNNVPTGVQTATEDQPRAFSLSVNDVDLGTAEVAVTVTSSNGTLLTLPATTGLTFDGGTGTNDPAMSFSGTLPDVNAALNGITVTPPLDFIGNSTVVITTNDQGASGAGVAGSDTDTINITWAAVNDAPVNTVPGPQTTPEDTRLALGSGLSVSDVDATTTFVQITLNASGGTVSLGSPGAVTFAAGDGTDDATMTFTGTLTNLNAALAGSSFMPAPSFAGNASLTMISNDLGNSGTGGARQDTDVVAIVVTGVNNPPQNNVPGPQTTNEDVARVFSAATGNPITVADVDATSLRVTLTATLGVLTLGSTTGLTFQAGDGSADTTMTFQGTIANLNGALNGLSFAPTPNTPGSALVTLFTEDLGATGAGGPKSASSMITVTIAPVNDPPDAVNDTLMVQEDAAATPVMVLANDSFAPDTGETLSVSAVGTPAHGIATTDGTTVSYTPAAQYFGTDSFTYTISDGALTDTATITVTIASVNDLPTATADAFTVLQNASATTLGVLSNDSSAPDIGETLTITQVTQPANGTVAILPGSTAVTYTPNAGFANTDPFDYTISDGNGGTATATVTVTVTPVNTKPVNSLPPPQLTTEDNALIFSSLSGNPITVADANNTTLTVQVTVTNGTFTLGSSTNLTVTANGTASVTLQGTIAALNGGLNNARYAPTPNFNGSSTLTISTNDTTGESDLDVLTLTVTAVNDAPVNVTPGTMAQAATEDVPRTFTNVSTTDVDVGGGQLLVTLTSDNATLISLSATTGLAFTAGDGTADATMTFTGTLPNVNAALNGLTVTPPANFIGNSTLVMTTSDQGNAGQGGTGQDTDTLTLTWSAVNDPPVNGVPPAQTTAEEQPRVFSAANGNALTVTDVDVSAGLMQLGLSANGGTLTLATTAGLTFAAGDGTSDATMTFTGTLGAVNTALDGLVYTPAADFAGAGSVTIVSNDLGSSGSGGVRSDTDVVAVNVSGVNDAPVNTVPGTQTTNEDVARVFSAANGNLLAVADVDAVSLQVSLSANNGTLTLATRTGLSFQAGDGTSDATMTFQGTVAAINSGLNGLVFAPNPNFNGAASISVLTSDLGSSGSGGTLTQSSTVTVNVTPVNDPPDAVNDALTVAEDGPATDVLVLANDTFAPDTSETLTITAVTAPSNGTAAIAGTRVTYQPAANFNGADSFSYTISDGNGGTDTATVAVTVTSVNDVPTAVADSATVLQGSGPNAINVLANDSAAPDLGETLTVLSATTPANGTVAITGGGSGLTYAPTGTFTGTDTFTYTISDGRGGTASALVTVTVSMVNTKPVNTLPGPQLTIEDNQLFFSTTAGNALSVTDANNATLTVQISVTNGTYTLGATTNLTVMGNGTASVTLQGTLAALNTGMNNSRYAPALNFNGAATLTMSTNDSSGETDLDVLNLTVSAVNDAPVNTFAATAAAIEDTPRTFSTLSIADVDVGASQLQVTLTSDNGVVVTLGRLTGLSFTAGDGTGDPVMTFTGTLTNVNAALNGLTLTPPSNYIGTSNLVMTTSDLGNTGGGGAQQDTDACLVTWAADNDPPVNAVPGPLSVAEEGTLLFATSAGTGLSTSDVDVAAGTLRITFSATNGRVSLGNPSGVTFTAGTGTLDTTMTFTGTLAQVNAALDGSTFVPNLNYVGAATVTLVTNDQGNTGPTAKTDTDVIAVTVTPVNDAPVNTLPLPQSVNEDASLLFSTTNGNLVTVADVDATVLQLTLSTTNATITLVTRTGVTFQQGDGSAATSMTFTGPLMALNGVLNGMRFQPNANFNGVATLTILSRDLGATGAGGALSDEDTINVTVVPVNDQPTAAADAYTLAEDAPATDLQVLANDSSAPDTGETLTITAPGTPAHGTATTNGSRITYTPAANYFGPDTFTYTLSDGNGGTATATVSITLTSVNDPPDAVDDVASVPQGAAATAIPVLANDTFAPDVMETLTLTSTTPATHGTVALTGGGTGLTYRPAAGYSGPDSFGYTISDGNGGTDNAVVTVTVTAVNAMPAAVTDTLTVMEDAVGTLDVLANDTGLLNTPITVTLATMPMNGAAVVLAGNIVQYTPAANYAGTDAFTYRVTDVDGDTAVGTVNVTVSAVNDVPDAGADSVTTDEDTSARVTVLANDTGAVDLPITLTVVTQPMHGTTTVEVDKTITYQPAANYHGPDSFVYELADGNADRSRAAVSVTVTPVNDAPVAVSDTASTRVGMAIAIDVKANDTDVDLDMLSVSAVGTPTHGTAAIATDGRVTYTPAAGYTGPDTFSYTVADPGGLTAMGMVSVGVGVDTDGDGLGDLDEALAGTDPMRRDTDGDLLDDGIEVNLTMTNPLDDDSDDDGLLDGNEDTNKNGMLDTGETDAKLADTDGDGLQDGTEQGLATPQGSDTGATFIADTQPLTKTDPRNPDTDSGGKPDGQEDANHNGRVDTGETDPNRASDDNGGVDGDGDTVPDATDNCPTVANMNQADADGDGIGDACQTKGGCGCGSAEAGVAALLWGLLLLRRRRPPQR